MWTIIIITVIFIFIAVLYEYKTDLKADWSDYAIYSLIGLVFGLLIGFPISFVLPSKTEMVKETYRIEALQDNSRVNGSFFLGCGHINDEMKYVFYYEENGLYKLGQLDCNDVWIKYSDDNPKIEVLTRRKVKSAFINNFTLLYDEYKGSENHEYIIYVPKGAIKQDYQLDAQ